MVSFLPEYRPVLLLRWRNPCGVKLPRYAIRPVTTRQGANCIGWPLCFEITSKMRLPTFDPMHRDASFKQLNLAHFIVYATTS